MLVGRVAYFSAWLSLAHSLAHTQEARSLMRANKQAGPTPSSVVLDSSAEVHLFSTQHGPIEPADAVPFEGNVALAGPPAIPRSFAPGMAPLLAQTRAGPVEQASLSEMHSPRARTTLQTVLSDLHMLLTLARGASWVLTVALLVGLVVGVAVGQIMFDKLGLNEDKRRLSLNESQSLPNIRSHGPRRSAAFAAPVREESPDKTTLGGVISTYRDRRQHNKSSKARSNSRGAPSGPVDSPRDKAGTPATDA